MTVSCEQIKKALVLTCKQSHNRNGWLNFEHSSVLRSLIDSLIDLFIVHWLTMQKITSCEHIKNRKVGAFFSTSNQRLVLNCSICTHKETELRPEMYQKVKMNHKRPDFRVYSPSSRGSSQVRIRDTLANHHLGLVERYEQVKTAHRLYINDPSQQCDGDFERKMDLHCAFLGLKGRHFYL